MGFWGKPSPRSPRGFSSGNRSLLAVPPYMSPFHWTHVPPKELHASDHPFSFISARNLHLRGYPRFASDNSAPLFYRGEPLYGLSNQVAVARMPFFPPPYIPPYVQFLPSGGPHSSFPSPTPFHMTFVHASEWFRIYSFDMVNFSLSMFPSSSVSFHRLSPHKLPCRLPGRTLSTPWTAPSLNGTVNLSRYDTFFSPHIATATVNPAPSSSPCTPWP